MSVPWSHGDPRAVVAAIVADPRFHGATTSTAPEKTLLEIVAGWVRDRLHDLFHAVGRVLGGHVSLDTAIGIAVILAVAAASVVVLVRFVRAPGRRPVPARPAPMRIASDASSGDLIALALAAARAERWHDAASALVRAGLRALDESGRLRFDPARTSGEARRLLHDPAFDAFASEAATALFAANAATPERFARLRETYRAAFGVNV